MNFQSHLDPPNLNCPTDSTFENSLANYFSNYPKRYLDGAVTAFRIFKSIESLYFYNLCFFSYLNP